MSRGFVPIVVAISEYDDSAWKTLPVTDIANKLAEVFGAVPLTFSKGASANEVRDIIVKAINDLPDRSTLLLYWIGHGISVGGQHYLICKDSPAGKINGASAIGSTVLGELIAQSVAERIVVILDTCYSGGGAAAVANRYRESLAEQLDRDGWERVACVVASVHPLEMAVAGRFSQGVVSALEKPDLHRRWTGADEFIDPEILAIAAKDVLGKQHKLTPRYSKEGFGSDIIPNPLFRKVELEVDLEARNLFEDVLGEKQHFELSARGIESHGAGHFFSGRRRLLSQLCSWLGGEQGGVVILTGSPGSGKSAILGRIVSLSVPEIFAATEISGNLSADDPRPPRNIVRVAVHAKGKTMLECAQTCARAFGLRDSIIDSSDIRLLLGRMAEMERLSVVIFDALDEALAGEAYKIIDQLILPLAENKGIKILIGTRRNLSGGVIPEDVDRHHYLKSAFGSEVQIIDIADELKTEDDIADFVQKRLRAANWQGIDTTVEEAAWRVAAAADRSFLYARLVARSLEARPNTSIGTLPSDANAAFVSDIQERYPRHAVRVTDMLRALAFGLGKGLSRKVWPVVSEALSGRTYSDDDVAWMLGRVGSYIVESSVITDGRHQAVYRLIHQALADHLIKSFEGKFSWDLIFKAVEGELKGDRWLDADPYLQRHLGQHAMLADSAADTDVREDVNTIRSQYAGDRAISSYSIADRRLDRLLAQPGFLAIADPQEVAGLLHLARSERANQNVGLYQLSRRSLANLDSLARWSVLHLQAVSQSSNLANLFNPPQASRWRCIWTRTTPLPMHHIVAAQDGAIECLVFGEVDGQPALASGGSDMMTRVWDARTGLAISAQRGHGVKITSIAYGLADGQPMFVSGSEDGTLRFWNARTSESIGTLLKAHEAAITGITFAIFDGEATFVSSSDDGFVHFWDAATRERLPSSIHYSDRVKAIAFDNVENWKYFAVSTGWKIDVWHAGATGTHTGHAINPVDHCNSLTFAERSGGQPVLVAATGASIQVWDLPTHELVSTEPMKQAENFVIPSIASSMIDGRQLLASADCSEVQLWDLNTGARFGPPLVGHEYTVRSVVFGHIDSQLMLFSGSEDGTARRWDLSGHRREDPSAKPRDIVHSVAFGRINGRPVLVTGGEKEVRLWDATTGEDLGIPLLDNGGMTRCVAFQNFDGKALVASIGEDSRVRVRDSWTGATLSEAFPMKKRAPIWVALGQFANATILFTGEKHEDQWQIRSFDLNSMSFVEPQINVPPRRMAFGFIEDQPVIVTYHHRVQYWDARTGEVVYSPFGDERGIDSLTLGRLHNRPVLVSSCKGSLRVHDARDGREIHVTNLGRRISSIAVGENNEIFLAQDIGLLAIQFGS